MDRLSFEEKTTVFLEKGKPFFFLINFDQTQLVALDFEEAKKQGIYFDIKGCSNITKQKVLAPIPEFRTEPLPFSKYEKGFNLVRQEILKGNSFLLNLTYPTPILNNLDLENIFYTVKAPYKLYYKDNFVCFSPECFVTIKDNFIYSYPMKGTAAANMANAEKMLLENAKEIQEHNTIVDLIRNDLSLIAKEVTVTKYRYLEKINTKDGGLYQTSSEIRGKLSVDWKQNFATLLFKMLPAGSISGAPKEQTVKIIKEAEQYDRGFYTGIFGIFDGKKIDTGVAIRFIEKTENGYSFKSGGGITHQSLAEEEYEELLKKVYVPTF